MGVYIPKTISEFYVFTVDIIYTLIIGLSFAQLNDLITPFEKLFQNWFLISGVGFVYYIIISGWIGYHNSIQLQPHWGRYGTGRYIIDLAIVLVVYNLLLVSNPNSFTMHWENDTQIVSNQSKPIMYWEIFIYLIPLLFTFYTIWDAIKFFEFRKRYYPMTGTTCGLKITFIFGMLTILIASTYLLFIYYDMWQPYVSPTRTTLDFGFILVYIGHIGLYRLLKSQS
jgi:hypothetical protein